MWRREGDRPPNLDRCPKRTLANAAFHRNEKAVTCTIHNHTLGDAKLFHAFVKTVKIEKYIKTRTGIASLFSGLALCFAGCSTASSATIGPVSVPIAAQNPQRWSEVQCAVDLHWRGLGRVPGHLRSWVDQAMNAVASIDRGLFPVKRIHIEIDPLDHADRAVVFGLLRRGPPASVQLLIDQNASATELAESWVLVHELSHLWLPRLRNRDKWLTEGVATYLQEVLRARSGMQRANVAWQNLIAGFDRGAKVGTGKTLTDESQSMLRTGAFHRVYWAGASFALHADVHLRSRGTSLLKAIVQSHHMIDKGLTNPKTAIELVRFWEMAANVEGLSVLARQFESQKVFDSPLALLLELGVTPRGPKPEVTSLAQQIMTQ